MATIPFMPGATAGALLWRQNCDPDVGCLGCIPEPVDGDRDFIAWCSLSELAVALDIEIEELSAINTCVTVPASRTVTGAAGTIQGCRVQDAALIELVDAGVPVVFNDPDYPETFTIDDEVGYAYNEFGATSGCANCGAVSCDRFSMLLWLCAYPLKGCVTPLPDGLYAVVALPSFTLTQPKTIQYGGSRKDLDEDSFDFEMDIADVQGNLQFSPCVDPCATGEDVPANRGPYFQPDPAVEGDFLPIYPDTNGLGNSPLAVWLTEVPPPVACDCCGEAGFWVGQTGPTPEPPPEPEGLAADGAPADGAEDHAAHLAGQQAAAAAALASKDDPEAQKRAGRKLAAHQAKLVAAAEGTADGTVEDAPAEGADSDSTVS